MFVIRIIRIAFPLLVLAAFGAVTLAQTSTTTSTAAAAPAAAPAQPGVRHRVAVMSFDYGTVHSNVAAIFGSDQDIGKGITDLLVQKLVQEGTYSVIERSALDKLMTEQNFSNSDRADATSAAKIGKLLGVDCIIIGSITQFGRDDKHTNVGGGGYSGWTHGIGGVGVSKAKAVVGITARMVNVNTGEILAAVTGTGESERGTLPCSVAAGTGGAGAAAAWTWVAATSETPFSARPHIRPWTMLVRNWTPRRAKSRP